MAKVIVGIVVVLVLVGGGYFLLNKNTLYPTTTRNNQSSVPSVSPSPSSSTGNNQQATATITYTNDGFSPSKIMVKMGDIVAIKNTSSKDMQLDSDPHPSHTDDTELNVGVVGAGQTKTFVLNKMGTFGFHNHVLPIDTGSITVQ